MLLHIFLMMCVWGKPSLEAEEMLWKDYGAYIQTTVRMQQNLENVRGKLEGSEEVFVHAEMKAGQVYTFFLKKPSKNMPQMHMMVWGKTASGDVVGKTWVLKDTPQKNVLKKVRWVDGKHVVWIE